MFADRSRSRRDLTLKVTGPNHLSGTIRVQGAKNTALKVLPATAAVPGVYTIHRLPFIADTEAQLEILAYLGAKIRFGDLSITLDTRPLVPKRIPHEMTRTSTAAFYFAGALLGRFGHCDVGRPGGDDIGNRPINYHVDAFRALGASVIEVDDSISATLPRSPRNASFEVIFPRPSAGASVNTILVAAASRSRLSVKGVPRDSDTEAFVQFLRLCGFCIGWTDEQLVLEPNFRPDPGAAQTFVCPADRNEAVTWMAAGALSTSGIRILDFDANDLAPAVRVFRSLGASIEVEGTTAYVQAPNRGLVTPADFEVVGGGSPGFHSDWLPFVQLCLTQSHGSGMTVDTLHSNRVEQARLLGKMGADISARGGRIGELERLVTFSVPLEDAQYIVVVNGTSSKLRAIETTLTDDVRASAVAILAASLADGTSIFHDARALYRGYQDPITRFRSLGIDVT